MEAKELRIGNILSVNGLMRPIDILDLNRICGVEVAELITYTPIHLNEEWLLKLGFILGTTSARLQPLYHMEGIYFYVDPETLMPLDEEGMSIAQTRVDYVHQFQNLCFAITGEDLSIKKQEL